MEDWAVVDVGGLDRGLQLAVDGRRRTVSGRSERHVVMSGLYKTRWLISTLQFEAMEHAECPDTRSASWTTYVASGRLGT